MNGFEQLADLPVAAQIGLGVLVLCQLVAMVWSLVVLAGDKRPQIAGIPRLVWLVIIVFGQLLGPVAFLILQAQDKRRDLAQRQFEEQSRHQQAQQPAAQGSTRDVIDRLYQ